MPPIPDQKEVDRLVKIYREAEKRIADGIKKLDPAKPFTANRKALLRGLKEVEKELLEKSREWTEEVIPPNHEFGAGTIISQMKKDKVADIVTKTTRADTLAINSLITETNANFAQTMQGVTRSSIQLLTETRRRSIIDNIASGVGAGEGTPQIARNIAQDIRDSGITAFTNKAGRRVNLTNYARMLSRTTVMQARNNGAVTRLALNGQKFGKISKHADIDGWDICNEYEGKIVNLSDPAIPLPPYHPNCRHIVQYVPPSELKNRAGTATTIKQAENFAKGRYADKVSYKGVSVNTANQINRTMETQFNNFKLSKIKEIKVEKMPDVFDAEYLPDKKKLSLNVTKFQKGGDFLRKQRIVLREMRITTAQKNERLSRLRKSLTQSRRVISDTSIPKATRDQEKEFAVIIQNNIDNMLGISPQAYYDAGDFDTIPRVIRHELGHVAVFQNEGVQKASEEIFKKGINLRDLSEYSKANHHEMMAEAFNAFSIGDKARVPKELFPLLNRLVK